MIPKDKFGLTKKQKALLRFFCKDRKLPPTVRETAHAMGLAGAGHSYNGVYQVIKRLRKMGYMEPGCKTARSLLPTPAGIEAAKGRWIAMKDPAK